MTPPPLYYYYYYYYYYSIYHSRPSSLTLPYPYVAPLDIINVQTAPRLNFTSIVALSNTEAASNSGVDEDPVAYTSTGSSFSTHRT